MSLKAHIVAQTEKLFRAGKYDRAVKEYEKLLSQNPSNMRVKLKLAETHLRGKNMTTALRLFREVADEYTRDQFYLKAIALYKTILKHAPMLIEVNEILGDLYQKVGLDPDALKQYHIVANFYDSKGLTQESAGIRRKIVEADPTNAAGRIRLAEVLQASGKAKESLQEYEKAVRILEEKKETAGLMEILEKILYFRSADRAMLEQLCQIYFKKRDFKRALKRIEGAPSDVRKQASILELWSEALLEERQTDAARKKFMELYQASLEADDAERSARVYSRILQEFSDDRDYLKEVEVLRQKAGSDKTVVKTLIQPKFRQDFEKTEIIDLDSPHSPHKK